MTVQLGIQQVLKAICLVPYLCTVRFQVPVPKLKCTQIKLSGSF